VPVGDCGVLDQEIALLEVLPEDEHVFLGVCVDVDMIDLSDDTLISFNYLQLDFWFLHNAPIQDLDPFISVLCPVIQVVIHGLHHLL
jgi:hypothetical protein